MVSLEGSLPDVHETTAHKAQRGSKVTPETRIISFELLGDHPNELVNVAVNKGYVVPLAHHLHVPLAVELVTTAHDELARGRVQAELDRKSTRLNSSHSGESRMPSSA